MMKDRIIYLGLKIVEWFCSVDYLEMVQGDLVELYQLRIGQRGMTRASFGFMLDCLVSVFIFFSKGHSQYSNNTMDLFRINLVTGYRSILKNKITSVISLLGLILGLVATMLILQYIHFEEQYDAYHPNVRNLYRASMNIISKDNTSQSAGTYYGLGERAGEAFPEIVNQFTTTFNMGDLSQLRYQGKNEVNLLKVSNVYHADPSLLEIFHFDLLEGSFKKALTGTRNAVITHSLSKRMSADGSIVGRTIYWEDTPFEVVAVVADQPVNSHFKFDMILPMDQYKQSTPEYREKEWRWYGYYNYYVLSDHADVHLLENKFDAFILDHMGQKPYTIDVFLQRVTDIHLGPQLLHQPEAGGSQTSVNLLKIIAVLIVLIAYTNYINLTTSTYLQRSREIGIRKVLGSSRKLLIRQLLTESLMINISAGIAAIALVLLLQPYVPELIEGFPDFYFAESSAFWFFYSVAIICLGLISGLYPAVLVANQRGVLVLSGTFLRNVKGVNLHQFLVMAQFLIASVLILFTIVVNRQLHYMLGEDLGTNIDQTLVLKAPLTGEENNEGPLGAFRDELEQNPNLGSVSYSTSLPGQPTYGNSIRLPANPEDSYVISRIVADENYLPLFEIPLIAGRNFRRPFHQDRNGILINEQAASLLDRDPEDLVNKLLMLSGDTVRVLGIVANYHHNSLHSDYEPIVITYSHDMQYMTYLSIRILSSQIGPTVKDIEALWSDHFPSSLFDFFFADEAFDRQYRADQRLSGIVNTFSAIAIVIACLGLFALSLYATLRRRKEVGIRKVLGTPISSLFWLLSRSTLSLIIVSGVMAIPVSYGLADAWLSNFSNRIAINPGYLFLPILITTILSLLTISHNILKAAYVNPVEILRQE